MNFFLKTTFALVILAISVMSCSSGDNDTVEGFIEYGAENYNTLNADEKKFLALAALLNEDEKELGDKVMFCLKYRYDSSATNKVARIQKEINMEILSNKSNIRTKVMSDFIETYDKVCFMNDFGGLENIGK